MVAKKTLAGLLVCAAVLWLAAACGEDGDQGAGGCERGTSELVSRDNLSDEEYRKHTSKMMPAETMRNRHRDLLWRQPNVAEVTTGFLRDGKGGWTDTWGITVWVTEKVDQGALPPEDRIPDHLEGIPGRSQTRSLCREQAGPSATTTPAE